ncbi:MAG: ABC transporter substrate-binding protein, partial [Pseudomonadota bacterium]
MNSRRGFLAISGAGLASVPMMTSAQVLPTIKWRLTSSFPKSIDILYGAAELIAKRVAAATGGKFQIQVFAAGEIV